MPGEKNFYRWTGESFNRLASDPILEHAKKNLPDVSGVGTADLFRVFSGPGHVVDADGKHVLNKKTFSVEGRSIYSEKENNAELHKEIGFQIWLALLGIDAHEINETVREERLKDYQAELAVFTTLKKDNVREITLQENYLTEQKASENAKAYVALRNLSRIHSAQHVNFLSKFLSSHDVNINILQDAAQQQAQLDIHDLGKEVSITKGKNGEIEYHVVAKIALRSFNESLMPSIPLGEVKYTLIANPTGTFQVKNDCFELESKALLNFLNADTQDPKIQYQFLIKTLEEATLKEIKKESSVNYQDYLYFLFNFKEHTTEEKIALYKIAKKLESDDITFLRNFSQELGVTDASLALQMPITETKKTPLTSSAISSIDKRAREKITGEAQDGLFLADLTRNDFKANKLKFYSYLAKLNTVNDFINLIKKEAWDKFSTEEKKSIILAFTKTSEQEKASKLYDIFSSIGGKESPKAALKSILIAWLKDAFPSLSNEKIAAWHTPWSQDMSGPIAKLIVGEERITTQSGLPEMTRLPFAQYCATQGATILTGGFSAPYFLLKNNSDFEFLYENDALKSRTVDTLTISIKDNTFCNGAEISWPLANVSLISKRVWNGEKQHQDFSIESGACDSSIIAALLENPNAFKNSDFPYIVYQALKKSISENTLTKEIVNTQKNVMEKVPLSASEKFQLLLLIADKLEIPANLSDMNLSYMDLSYMDSRGLSLENAVLNDKTYLSAAELKNASWEFYKHHILDPVTGEFLAEVIVDRKTFEATYSSVNAIFFSLTEKNYRDMMFTLYHKQLAETLRVCLDSEKEVLLEKYKRFCEIMGKPQDLSTFDLSGTFKLTISQSTLLPKKIDGYKGEAFYEYQSKSGARTQVSLNNFSEFLRTAFEEKKLSFEKYKAISGLLQIREIEKHGTPAEKSALNFALYKKLRVEFSKAGSHLSLNQLYLLIDAAKKSNVAISDATDGMRLRDDAVYRYVDKSGIEREILINKEWGDKKSAINASAEAYNTKKGEEFFHRVLLEKAKSKTSSVIFTEKTEIIPHKEYREKRARKPIIDVETDDNELEKALKTLEKKYIDDLLILSYLSNQDNVKTVVNDFENIREQVNNLLTPSNEYVGQFVNQAYRKNELRRAIEENNSALTAIKEDLESYVKNYDLHTKNSEELRDLVSQSVLSLQKMNFLNYLDTYSRETRDLLSVTKNISELAKNINFNELDPTVTKKIVGFILHKTEEAEQIFNSVLEHGSRLATTYGISENKNLLAAKINDIELHSKVLSAALYQNSNNQAKKLEREYKKNIQSISKLKGNLSTLTLSEQRQATAILLNHVVKTDEQLISMPLAKKWGVFEKAKDFILRNKVLVTGIALCVVGAACIAIPGLQPAAPILLGMGVKTVVGAAAITAGVSAIFTHAQYRNFHKKPIFEKSAEANLDLKTAHEFNKIWFQQLEKVLSIHPEKAPDSTKENFLRLGNAINKREINVDEKPESIDRLRTYLHQQSVKLGIPFSTSNSKFVAYDENKKIIRYPGYSDGRPGATPAAIEVSATEFYQKLKTIYEYHTGKKSFTSLRHRFFNKTETSDKNLFDKIMTLLEHAEKEPNSATKKALTETLAYFSKTGCVKNILTSIQTTKELLDLKTWIQEGKLKPTTDDMQLIADFLRKHKDHPAITFSKGDFSDVKNFTEISSGGKLKFSEECIKPTPITPSREP